MFRLIARYLEPENPAAVPKGEYAIAPRAR